MFLCADAGAPCLDTVFDATWARRLWAGDRCNSAVAHQRQTVAEMVGVQQEECIGVVRDAYLAHADGESVNPDSYFLRFPTKPDCRIIALPAYLGNGFNVAGLKWIASFPGNVRRGFPAHRPCSS